MSDNPDMLPEKNTKLFYFCMWLQGV